VTGERLLGLDIGARRIGVAVSDEFGTIASPVAMIDQHTDVIAQLRDLIARYGAKRLVAGLPVSMSGQEGLQAADVRAQADALAQAVGLPLEYYDERLTTSIAEQTLIAQGTRRDKRKGRIDAVAAAVILQGYLDNQRWKANRRRR
jgi:putative Holliday junction resolvase